VTLLAVIADTHMPRGVRRLPDVCIDRLAAADLIVHAGDFTGAEVLEEMSSLGPPIEAVHGNMDDLKLVERLPERRTAEVEGVRIGIVHDGGPARGRLGRLRRSFPDADAVVFAHSHMPLHEREEGFQIFNPGSPTERRRAPAHTMGMARVEEGSIEFELVALD
jgi:putative phosphoesterase